MSTIGNDLDVDTYIGVALPMGHGLKGFFERTKTSLEQTKHNIKNLLLTRRGERLGNPTFGSDLLAVCFEIEGDDLETKVEETIESAMSEFLPFVIIESIETKFSDINRNTINVSMRFTLNVDSASSETLSIDVSNY